MEIEYKVEKHWLSFGRVEIKSLARFDSVENAIEFHKKQKTDSGTWFVIVVNYEGQ